MRAVRVLSVTPFVPTARSPYAGHQWYWHHLQRLVSRGCEVTVLAPDVPANHTDAPWPVVLTAPRPKAAGVWGEIGALRLAGRADPVPTMPAESRGFDVVELAWSPVMSMAPAIRRMYPAALIVSHQHDRYSATLTWGRLRRLRLRRRLRDAVARYSITVEEMHAARSCDLLVGFKAEDLEWATRMGAEIMVVPPHIDPPRPLRTRATPRDVVFVAAFDRAENVEAAEWLLGKVWPRVVAASPDARLVLAGGNPGPSVRAMASDTVEVTGYVDDLDDVYAPASCVVAPIFGGGA